MDRSKIDNKNLSEIINRKLIVGLHVSIRNSEPVQRGHLLTDCNFVKVY